MNSSVGATDKAITSERFAVSFPEGAIAGWRFPNQGAPRLLFAHANGFCASAYKQMLARVARRFDVWAIDLRGHGRTTLPADPQQLRDWRTYGQDVAALLDHPAVRTDEGWVLAGHSCGAISGVLAARGRRDVSRLALIEPVIPPRWFRIAASTPFWPRIASRWQLVRGARARRRAWATREAVRESYARKAIFFAWAPGVLDDYLEDGLVPSREGVTLSCNPDWEAATFAAQAHDIWGAFGATPAAVGVLAADHPSSTVHEWARRRLIRRGAEVLVHQGAGHLLPMEAPDAAANFILGEAGGLGRP